MSDTKTIEAMRSELLDLMPVATDSDWGPQPIVCRWCGCWLRYGDKSEGKPIENHARDCFAHLHLDRPGTKKAGRGASLVAEDQS